MTLLVAVVGGCVVVVAVVAAAAVVVVVADDGFAWSPFLGLAYDGSLWGCQLSPTCRDQMFH